MTLLAVALTAGRQTPAASGTATIRGTATDTVGAAPAGLFVIVFPADEARWSGPGSDTRVKRFAVTDGRFEVTGLSPAEYKLTFATEAMLGGWPSPATLTKLNANKPVPIRLGVGELVGVESVVNVSPDGVTMSNTMMSRSTIETVRSTVNSAPPGTLPPGRGRPAGPPAPTSPGAISGRVTDADGKPVAGIEVRTMLRRAAANGTVQFLNSTSAMTDADGRYRVANRAAGDYVVMAQAYSNDTNSFVAHVRRAPPPVAGPDGRQLGYVTTFHGGAMDPARAIVVSVTTEERTDININLVRMPVWNVTGKVSGRLPVSGAGPVLIVSPVDFPDAFGVVRTRRVAVAFDGTFEVADVPEGEYLVSITNVNGWAETRVRVAGRSPDPITLTMQPPKTVSGRVEFLGSTPAPAIERPIGPTRPAYMVELRPAQLTMGASFSSVPVQPDGTFSVRGSGPGPFRLQGVAAPPWVPIAGFVNGIDTLDIPQSLDANVDGAVVILADRLTALLVKVTDDADQPVADVGVVVFSEDPRYWPVRSRRVQWGMTMPGGACALSNLPPGKYFVVATREVRLNSAVTPALIEQLKSRALPFELAAGESRSIQVRVR